MNQIELVIPGPNETLDQALLEEAILDSQYATSIFWISCMTALNNAWNNAHRTSQNVRYLEFLYHMHSVAQQQVGNILCQRPLKFFK